MKIALQNLWKNWQMASVCEMPHTLVGGGAGAMR